MIAEVKNFLKAYQEVKNEVTFDIDQIDYSAFLRSIGQYIYKDFNEDSWKTSCLQFKNILIDFSAFENTIYEERVFQFLLALKNIYNDQSIQDEIYSFLESTDMFTKEEKAFCKEFYDRVCTLNNAMKKFAMEHPDQDIGSKENIKYYHEEMKSYNEFANTIVQYPKTQKTIERFDIVIRHIASLKKQPDLHF